MTRARFQYYTGVMGSLVYFFCVISTFKSVHGDVKGSFKDVPHPKKVTKLNYEYLIFKSAKTAKCLLAFIIIQKIHYTDFYFDFIL